ncbi:MAG: hypothetical protein AB7N24_20235 [Dehalococcoidia bacterium]
MLGTKIGEETGKVTARRVLPGDPERSLMKIETSFESQGTIYGTPMQDMGTYTIVERVPGQIYGEGQGMLMTNDGAGIIWNGQGVGKSGPDGTISFAAAVTFQASDEKFSKLNGLLGVIEHKMSLAGDVNTTTHEWKPA